MEDYHCTVTSFFPVYRRGCSPQGCRQSYRNCHCLMTTCSTCPQHIYVGNARKNNDNKTNLIIIIIDSNHDT